MVVFTCNACGQSVKKAQVEKHYTVQCRDCTALSCMDCGKDFWGDEYKEHIKCVTEEEKYSGKDYKPKPGANKGEKKQEEWIQHIQKVVENMDKKSDLCGLLNNMLNYNNIPRKEKKFQRFVENSLGIRNQKLTQEAWKVFSEAQKSKDEENKVSAETAANVDEKKDEEIKSESVTDNAESKKSKKKKKPKEKDENSEVVTEDVQKMEVDNAEIINGNGTIESKKKKRKHQNESKEAKAETNVTEVGSDKIIDDSTTEPKKKKKKPKKIDGAEAEFEAELKGLCATKESKKKRKHQESENVTTEDNGEKTVKKSKQDDDSENVDPEESPKESKKKRKEKKSENIVEGQEVAEESEKKPKSKNSEVVEAKDEVVEESKKKRKNKGSENDEKKNNESVVAENGEELNGSTKTDKFKWKKIIMAFMEAHEHHEIHLKKLRKKVMASYTEWCSGQTQNYDHDKFCKKFQQSLLNDKLVVENNKVKLVE